MKVRVDKCSKDTFWYNSYIGKVFEVKGTVNENYQVKVYQSPFMHFILKSDCTVLSNDPLHPAHYGGGDNPYEVIKVIEAWNLPFSLGNVLKYVYRAGKKGAHLEIEDFEKAKWYIDRHIENLKKKV